MMTGSLAIAESGDAPTRELRIYERFQCDVAASCQPPSDWKHGGKKWTARVRNVSAGGLCLVVGRRFERGAGLAVVVPGTDRDSSSTLLARVMNIRAEGAGTWVLGCALISPLSDEELEALTQSAESDSEVVQPNPIADVFFRGTLPGGRVVECFIRKLNRNGQWPLPAGRFIGLRFRDGSGPAAPVMVRVDACRPAAGRWVLECTFVGPPPVDLLGDAPHG